MGVYVLNIKIRSFLESYTIKGESPVEELMKEHSHWRVSGIGISWRRRGSFTPKPKYSLRPIAQSTVKES